MKILFSTSIFNELLFMRISFYLPSLADVHLSFRFQYTHILEKENPQHNSQLAEPAEITNKFMI